jgi:hypothetical protein
LLIAAIGPVSEESAGSRRSRPGGVGAAASAGPESAAAAKSSSSKTTSTTSAEATASKAAATTRTSARACAGTTSGTHSRAAWPSRSALSKGAFPTHTTGTHHPAHGHFIAGARIADLKAAAYAAINQK